jgi:cellulose synthase/poly-beta-1,6-N-acetylglucosamine synthase-like glycosyltransferase
VAARNEEKNIRACLMVISKQNYPAHKFEVIVVDDASTDSTNEIIQQFVRTNSNFSGITLTEDKGGKKNAINSAIEKATGELIVTTDADCVMGENWLTVLVAFFEQTGSKMIVAPVCFHEEKTIFEKMQSLEFMALIASTGGALFFNKAIMCNGANLAYTKQVFDEVNGFADINKIASGDDVLLMYKIKKLYPKGVHFLKHTDAVVYTKAKSTIKDFLSQRTRWASKGFTNLNRETKFVSLMVYLFNLMMFLLIVLTIICSINSCLNSVFLKSCLTIIGVKLIVDFLVLFLSTAFFKKRKFLIWFLPEFFLYTLYVLTIGLLTKFNGYKWKGRSFR